MTIQLISASYNDAVSVNFTPDAWFNATAVAANFGKRVNDWLNLDSTKDYIKRLHRAMFPNIQLPENMVIKKNQLLKIKGGAPSTGGGSWLHPKLSIKFARWLNVDFEIWCDMQIEKILHPVPYGLKRLPEPPAITKAQAGILYNKVCAIAGGDNKIRSAVWKRFQNHFALSSYKDLPAEKFDEAVAYLEAKQEEYRQGVEMLYISTKELDLLIREQLAALPAPEAKTGEFIPKAGSVTLTIHPIEDDKPKRWLVTQSLDGKATMWMLTDDIAVMTREQLVSELERGGHIFIDKSGLSARKVVMDHIPNRYLIDLIEAAAQQLKVTEASRLAA